MKTKVRVTVESRVEVEMLVERDSDESPALLTGDERDEAVQRAEFRLMDNARVVRAEEVAP